MTEKKDTKISNIKNAQKALSRTDKYEKYAKGTTSLKQHITAKVPKWLKTNVIANATLFILGSAMWMFGAHTRSFDPDYDQPGGPKTGPYLEQRTYQQALKDAYWPMVNGEYAPDFDWYLTMGMIVVFAAFSLAGTVISANKSYKKDLKAAKAQVDIMLEIEKLAQEHHLDATAAKKIVKVAPEIIKHMSKDSRVYFDMIMDGKVFANDENFMGIAAAVMAGHLQSHPEDAKRMMDMFDDKTMANEIMNMYNQNNRNSK